MKGTGAMKPSSMFYVHEADVARIHHYLEECSLCGKSLSGDIFMYRGDTPFCSEECRQQQIEVDRAKHRRKKHAAAHAVSTRKEHRHHHHHHHHQHKQPQPRRPWTATRGPTQGSPRGGLRCACDRTARTCILRALIHVQVDGDARILLHANPFGFRDWLY